MPQPIRWGVLGVAGIAVRKVIPAMQQSPLTPITAIASRSLEKARDAAANLGIPKAYGSYEELLADPEIDAIYNPLPNHLHVPWSMAAAKAGKHVLCEKPLGLTTEEVLSLIEVRDQTGVRMAEAFMVHTHPQWLRAIEIIQSGEIGDLRVIQGAFHYFNIDPANVRNMADIGGGGLMDIGCYPIHISRWIFGREPRAVIGLVERDPAFGTDRLASALLDYGSAQCLFDCSTQLVPHQRVQLFGAKGRVEVLIPFNAPPGEPSQIIVDIGGALDGSGIRREQIPAVDQYRLQGDAFSNAILTGGPVPVPLEDSVGNMRVIEAIFRSAETGKWEQPG